MSEFLPKDYKEPVEPGYLKLKAGENRIRAISPGNGSPALIEGWRLFYEDAEGKHVIRWRTNDDTPDIDGVPTGKRRHFWAFWVWSYDDECVHIMEISQKTIRTAIENLVVSNDWGLPFAYDIIVTKTGDGFDTDYSVMPSPKKKVDAGITKKMAALGSVDLNELYRNGNPYNPEADAEDTPVDLSNTDSDVVTEADNPDKVPF
tara:strand:- start:3994 stop:4605 length:612 start_codon:yes stop_codon:yes gene_type:complete